MAVDAMQSQYATMSSYNYGNCNPVVFNDPSGNQGEQRYVTATGQNVLLPAAAQVALANGQEDPTKWNWKTSAGVSLPSIEEINSLVPKGSLGLFTINGETYRANVIYNAENSTWEFNGYANASGQFYDFKVAREDASIPTVVITPNKGSNSNDASSSFWKEAGGMVIGAIPVVDDDGMGDNNINDFKVFSVANYVAISSYNYLEGNPINDTDSTGMGGDKNLENDIQWKNGVIYMDYAEYMGWSPPEESGSYMAGTFKVGSYDVLPYYAKGQSRENGDLPIYYTASKIVDFAEDMEQQTGGRDIKENVTRIDFLIMPWGLYDFMDPEKNRLLGVGVEALHFSGFGNLSSLKISNDKLKYLSGDYAGYVGDNWISALKNPLFWVQLSMPILEMKTTPKVAANEVPPLRAAYVKEVEDLSSIASKMRAGGVSSEEIARTLHGLRRELGVKYKSLTPHDKLQQIYQRNIERYGDKLGPSIDYLRNVQGKSWDDIINSATRTGGKDLGF